MRAAPYKFSMMMTMMMRMMMMSDDDGRLMQTFLTDGTTLSVV